MEGDVIECQECSLIYRIKDGIPVLIDESVLDEQHMHQMVYFQEETSKMMNTNIEPWQQSYLERLDGSVSIGSSHTVLDIGTGSGYVAIELAKRGATVLACDLNVSALLRIREIYEASQRKGNLILFACSALRLPLKDLVADVVISNAVLEHMPDEKQAILEMGRVAKASSEGFITVPLKLRYIWPFLWPINIIYDRRIGHLRRYDTASLSRVLEPIGFAIQKVFYTGHLLKVIGVVVETVLKTQRLDASLEQADKKKESSRYGASNLAVSIKRHEKRHQN